MSGQTLTHKLRKASASLTASEPSPAIVLPSKAEFRDSKALRHIRADLPTTDMLTNRY